MLNMWLGEVWTDDVSDTNDQQSMTVQDSLA